MWGLILQIKNYLCSESRKRKLYKICPVSLGFTFCGAKEKVKTFNPIYSHQSCLPPLYK